MILNMCKSCQYCLESMYWSCCEERFCFDKKIATYKLEDLDTVYSNVYNNMGASFNSVITEQPSNNNHLPQNVVIGRETNELPFNANQLYEVFSKSMIFRNDFDAKTKSTDSLDDFETKSEPDYMYEKPNRTKVYFEDEINSPVTDFEIMFKDEISHDMFKIDEEEEIDRNDEEGLVMNVSVKRQDIIKPSTITIKDEPKITTPNPIYEYDSSTSVPTLKTVLSLPRVESLKGILRQSNDLRRSASAKALAREDSKKPLGRVESMKNMDTNKMNRVLSRVPHRSASYLNIPEHLVPDKPPLTKSKSSTAMLSLTDSENRISLLPDTPIIKSNNLPRFFADTPDITEYKGETSLQSIKQENIMIFKENDFSMPRYYGTAPSPVEPMHESKSMPDLRNPSSTGKVSKRLVKIRSKLKPLVIKKGTDEQL